MRLRLLSRNLRTALTGGLIPPEIKGDGFFAAISTIAGDPEVRTILEIGASSGGGSTEALIEGAQQNPSRPVLHCIEVSPRRFRALAKRHRDVEFLSAHNVSSVSLERFATEERVRDFYEAVDSPLNSVPLPVVLGWLRSDIDTVTKNRLSRDRIRMIKHQEGLEDFDLVLIDGSEFTGSAELADVYGARFILLDDTLTFKNCENCTRLNSDEAYELIEKSEQVRNGYAIFRRVGEGST